MSKDQHIEVQSGVNGELEPFVQLIFNGKVIGQLSVENARQFALQILEIAEAAEQDRIVGMLFQEKLDLPLEQVMQFIFHMRKFRTSSGKRGPGVRPEDFVLSDDKNF